MWRFRGSPYYLDRQGERLGVSKICVDRARLNPEIHRVSTLLGQLCERYYKLARDAAGTAIVGLAEHRQVLGTLGECEREVEKLHALAAAAAAMVDEAHRAYGGEPPRRDFRVHCDFDEPADAPDVRPIRIQPGSRRDKVHTHGHGQHPEQRAGRQPGE